ncbi:MAG: beta-galactosidase [Sphingomonas sp.]|nr:beta-galactosidase [Sphingomonas sp.]
MWRLAALAWAALLAACAPLQAGPRSAAAAGRTITDLASGWQFRFDDALSPETAGPSTASWDPVTLPHSWNRLGEYRIGRTTATDNRQGKGWYRRSIDGRTLPRGKRHVIEFEGVGNIADLWVNGRHAGHHAGAFSRFRFDITDLLDPDRTNLILLRADNSAPAPDSTTRNVIPLLGDFFIHGGIYRPARLIHVPASHIALDDFGGPGVYADSHVDGDGTGRISSRVMLTGAASGQHMVALLHDAAGRIVARSAQAVAPGERQVALSLALPAARRWNGRADPYLYRLETRLVTGGRTLDSVTVPIGFRDVRIDAATGFWLNGRHVALHGVSRHQDDLGKGWALSPADHARDMALIAEMGANTVRFAHYQHAEDWFDLADRYGMVVWAEAPLVNKIAFGDAPASPELVANARQQLIELIRQNYNHPSVVTWGIANEIDIDLAFGRLGPRADPRPLLRELDALAHAEDRTRPTVLADCCEGTPGDKVPYLAPLTGQADLIGYNRYYGWYYGKVDDLGPHLDAMHARYPGVPISVSEYGAGAALSQHVENPGTWRINAGGRPHPEEFQSWLHERSWPQLRARPYLWASWIWNMFDFSSRVRQEGDATDINDKGLVTFDRKVRKDAFFYYKAQWSDTPVLHINSRRWRIRTDPLTSIRLYSNAPSVHVALNGRSLGNVPCIDRVCAVAQIRLAEGANRVEASARFGSRILRDRVEWTLRPQ